ncbi:DUF4352 domain-containing protein [Streptomyces sp. N2-109]|uniref:DUF4352 domain-containing protein n=1 Tax=Streptomyces gossypii TaxID=2883101 RepID=A0ABT2K0T1_9ACTN|nr:DUF4352 domain-containing protein [Streptomyces gossypii]MCT2592983.1 DUF4352 domain-containing protein [Streptomyces gossypii]MCT2593716.1 DUF4352 domain-containing protein [Streptomyces gossypii]
MSVRYLSRKRSLAATAVAAVLALGGLTACDAEEPTTKKAGSSSKQAKKGGAEAGGAQKEDTPEGPMAAGDTASYKSGLTVTVSEAAAYTPTEFASGHTEGNKAYKVTITLDNTGAKKIDAALIMATARAGEEGTEAEAIFDEQVDSAFEGKLLPGKKATASFAFDAPADAAVLDIEVDLLDFSTEPAQWSIKL